MERLDNCKNADCGKKLIHTEGRRPKEFCSPECRIKFNNLKNKKGGSKGRPKGAKNKFNKVKIDGFQMDVKTVPAYNVKPESEWTNEMNAIALPNLQPKWDFTGVVFLQIEDFTEYPKSKCPASGFERVEYLAKKKESDDKIRAAYYDYKQLK